MALIHLARQGFITKSALPSITRTRGASYQPSLLILGEGTNGSTSITDSSQNALAVTVVGNTNISTAQKPTGMTSSIYLDGTGDYLTIADNSVLELSNKNFTIEFWINTTGSTQYDALIARESAAPATSGMWQFLMNSASATAGDVAFWSYDYNSFTSAMLQTTGVSIRDGAWHHIALVRNGSSWAIYIDGVSRATQTSSITIGDISSGYWIGNNQQYPTRDFPGYLSNIRWTVGTALYTKNFVPPILPLSTTQASTVYPDLLLLGNGTNGSTTITDSSPNAFTITRNGDTNISTAQYPVGMTSSIYFDGTGDYVTAADNANLRPGAGAFTLEAWVYRSASGTAHTIYAKGGASTGIEFQVTSTNVLRFTATTTNIDSTGTIAATTWTHVAVVREGTGTNQTKLYINGTQDGQGTVATDFTQTEEVRVGTDRGATNNFSGYISNVRFTKGTALYTQKFNVPLLPLPSSSVSIGASPSLYITGNGINNSTNIIDSSSNAFTITRNGDTKISTTTAPTGMVSSIYFDGNGDYLAAPDSAFTLGSNDFTAECWFYATTLSTNIPNIFYINGQANTAYAALRLQLESNGAVLLLMTKTASSWDVNVSSATGVVQINTWYHVSVVRNGTNVVVYLNGSSIISTTVSGSLYAGVLNWIGRVSYFSSIYFSGYLSNIRIINGTALYTATFVPPPLPLLSNFNYISYPSLLLRGAGTNGSTTFTDSSPNAFTVTAFGNAQISTAQAPTGMSSSMYFDGTGDYLTISDNEAWDFGTGNFTVEAWVYPQGSAANQRIYSQYNTFANQVSLRRNDTNNVQFFVVSSSATLVNLTTTATLNINAWNQVAIVRNGNVFTIYLNGVSAATSTASITYPNVASSLFISTYDGVNEGWNGYISNIRFIKGAALYRSNFTPPVLPLSATPETNLTPSTTASTITNNVYGVYQLA